MTVERSGGVRHETSDPGIFADTALGDTLADRFENDAHQDDESLREERKGASLSPQIRDRIALQLRSMYDSVANQPVPDRFAELIARLDSTERDKD